MRLGQLSRKLKVKPQEIIDFINVKFDKELVVHPNVKIDDAFIDDIHAEFPTVINVEKEEIIIESENETLEIEPLEKEKEEEELPEKEQTPSFVEADSEKLTQDISEEIIPDLHSENEDANDHEIDVLSEEDLNIVDGIIKAPKLEVEGIKVVGKIDLPEKAIEVEETITDDDQTIQEDSENKPEKTIEISKEIKRDSNRKPVKNKPRRTKQGFSLEEQKRQEIEAYERRKKEQKEAEKRKKQKHYEKNLKDKQAKSTPKKKKPKKKIEHKNQQETSQPKSLWGKFIKWLNT